MRTIARFLGATLLALAMISCGPSVDPNDQWTGRDAPDFTVVTVEQPEPRKVKLSELKGKVVLLEFWATWCGPCRAVMPEIQRLHETYRDKGLVVVAVSDESETTLERYLVDRDYSYPVHRDFAGMAWGAYDVQAIPKTFLIDREGKIVWWEMGADPQALKRAVDKEMR